MTSLVCRAAIHDVYIIACPQTFRAASRSLIADLGIQ
jgi:hypothetical protein